MTKKKLTNNNNNIIKTQDQASRLKADPDITDNNYSCAKQWTMHNHTNPIIILEQATGKALYKCVNNN